MKWLGGSWGKKYKFMEHKEDSLFIKLIPYIDKFGILLLIAAIIALTLSNSSYSESFYDILHFELFFGIDLPLFHKSIQHWINDGLMVIFFFVVGLEIKREFVEGELSMPSQAILPIIAAIGGMAVPALFYIIFNKIYIYVITCSRNYDNIC